MNRAKLQRVVAANPHFTATRKMSLYSNFARLEELNPDGYEANIAAWKEVLEDALQDGAFADATCVEAGPELIKDLNDAENGMPLALNAVFDRMVADGTLVPLSQFSRAYPSTPASGLGARAVRALGWAFGLVSRPQWQSGAPEELRHEKYVDIAAVKSVAKRLVERLADATSKEGNSRLSQTFRLDRIGELDTAGLSATDIECGLSYAAATGQVHLDKSRNVVKLAKHGPVSEVDETIASLRTQIEELSAREAQLGAQVDAYTAQARTAVKTNRNAAKLLLQKRSIAEKSFERTSALLDQLHTVLQKIDDANDNQQAVAALESSSKVLSELNRSTNIEEVDAVMEQLHEEIGQTDSVTQSLAELNIGSDAAAELDELEIDEELGELESEERAKQLSSTLPTAPTHRPGQSEPAAEANSAEAADPVADRAAEDPINA